MQREVRILATGIYRDSLFSYRERDPPLYPLTEVYAEARQRTSRNKGSRRYYVSLCYNYWRTEREICITTAE